MATGLDQGILIPSFTILNGLRNNKNGFEFAFGPTVNLIRQAKGFYDESGNWTLASDIDDELMEGTTYFEERLDSRGIFDISTGFVFAVGKSFRSGRLNIPVNMYVVPNKDGARIGLSFGYNAKYY